jgi:signal peptide peptidase SppA
MKLFIADGQITLWAGDEASFEALLAIQRLGLQQATMPSVEKAIAAYLAGPENYDGSNGLPAMIEKRGNIGVLKISGSLINGAAGFWRFYGVVGYDDIVNAAKQIYSDPDVKKVLVQIESPGGMVDGIFDAGGGLGVLSENKPTLVYTGSQMASGGYWLGTSFKGDIMAGPTASVGSIGVVAIHTDLTKALEEAGVKKTVLRAGENKARLNPYEPLTDEVKNAELKKMADVHNIFRAQVQKGRPGMSTDELLAATDGSTFLGKRAKAAKLVDEVGSFEQALKLLDSQKYSGNTPTQSKGANMKLSHEQVAQLVAGVPIEQLGLNAEETLEAKALLDSIRNANKGGDDEPGGEKPGVNEGGGAAAPPAGKEGIGAVTDATKLAAQVELLTSQLAEVNEKLVAKTAEVQNLTAAQAPMKTQNEALLGIARGALGNLQVALGGSNTTEGMDAQSVIDQHTKLSASFLDKFKVGRQSVDAKEGDEKGVDPNLAQFAQIAQLAQQNRKRY